MPQHKLTTAKIAAAKSADKPYNLGDGAGLELVVHPSGGKNWILRYTSPAGRRREMGLGGYATLDLKAARVKAQQQRQLLLDGKDPQVERRKARIEAVRRGKLFATAVEEYIKLREEEWKWPRQAVHWHSQITRYANAILELPVDTIDTAMVLGVLEPIWRKKRGVARTLRSRLENIFDWAIYKGYSSQANPARWKHHLEYSLPNLAKICPIKNARSVSYREIGPFMLKVRRSSGVAALALDFLVLTGSRTTEVSDMEWKELDNDRALWTFPPRVKGRREGDGKRDHVVPLSRQAVMILEAIRRTPDFNGKYVFPGTARGPGDRLGRSMSAWSMLSLIKRLGYHDRLVTHGLRSVLNSWALDQGVPTEPRKMLLSHTVGDHVDEVYRGTEMIELRRSYSQRWADYVDAEVAYAAQIEARGVTSLPSNEDRALLTGQLAEAAE
jgi:integrase